MINRLMNYMDMVSTPELKLLYGECCDALMHSGAIGVEFQIDQLFETTDLGDAGDFLNIVNGLFQNALVTLMANFGVTISLETPVPICLDFFKGIMAADNWSDTAAIAAAIESDESTSEMLADVLEVTTGKPSTHFLPYLENVSQSLIDRIDECNPATGFEYMPSADDIERVKQRLRAFYAEHSAPILQKAINEESLLVGGDYSAMIDQYHSLIGDLDEEKASLELVAFALASDLKNDQVLDAVRKEITSWFENSKASSLLSRVDILLKELSP